MTRYYEPVCYYAQRKTSPDGTGSNLPGYVTNQDFQRGSNLFALHFRWLNEATNDPVTIASLRKIERLLFSIKLMGDLIILIPYKR